MENTSTVIADHIHHMHNITDMSQRCIETKEHGHGRPVPQMKDVHHQNAATKGGGRHGGVRGPWRGLNTCILETPADAPLERCEGHLGVWTPNVEKETVMTDAQVDSFSQEGAGESHWTNG
jgi:hypothetical protein